MKKLQLLCAFACCMALAFTTHAQGLYLRANIGYGFEAVGDVQGQNQTGDTNGLTSIENIYGSTATGLYPGIGVGYMFNKHFGIDFGIAYAFGTAKVQRNEVDYTLIPVQGSAATAAYTYTTKQLRVSPTLVVSAGMEDSKFNPYARFGLMIPVAGGTKVDIDATVDIPALLLTGDITSEATTSGQFTLGFDTAFGSDFTINDKMSLFAEFNFVALSIKSKKTTIEAWDGNYYQGGELVTNQTQLDAYANLGLYSSINQLPTFAAEINYVPELNASSNNADFNTSTDSNQPEDQLEIRDNYNSFGLVIGIKYHL